MANKNPSEKNGQKSRSGNIFKNKIFRYGAASVVFVAVVLLLVITVNIVFTVLASRFHWYVDMTEKQMYTVSKTSEELLGGIKGEQVTIKFMQKKDKIEDETYDDAGDSYLRQIHELALDYQAKFPNLIKLKYVDLYAERAETAPYIDRGYKITPTTVVFDNGKGLINVYPYTSFLTSDKKQFKGEHKITATVLSLCRGIQTAYIISGHGEDQPSSAFLTILQSCGYNNIIEGVVLNELTEEKIAEDKPRLMVMINPKTDIRGAIDEDGSKTEKNDVYWLEYLTGVGVNKMPLTGDQPYASLMVFAGPAEDPEQPSKDFPNLNSVLYKWGMELHKSEKDLVKETQNNVFGGADLYKILPSYTELMGEPFYNRVAIDGAGTVHVFDAESASNGAYLTVSQGAVNENPLFPAAGKAVLAFSERGVSVENNKFFKYNCAVACADSSIISESYLNSSSYANEAMITLLVSRTIDERSGSGRVDIEYKDYVSEQNVNASLTAKKAFLIIMTVVIPAAILGAGIAIYVIRRNKV